jgi:hypothetical protein
MGALQKTGLVIVAAPLPANFAGNIQEYFEAIVKRMEIQSPVGTNFFVISDTEPETNQGPWFKEGTKIYVFSESAATYVPLDITDSLPSVFTTSDAEPGAPGVDDALIWLRTSNDRVIGWYFWNGLIWRPGGNVPPSGPTSSRPTVPQDLEQYFDTDIDCMIHWERGAWRTVSGTPGDVKFVTTTTLAAAITSNPGWEYLAESTQSWRGKVLAVASKDPGGSPVASYLVDANVTQRSPGDTFGSEGVILTSAQIEQHSHLVGGLSALNSGNTARFYRVDDGENISTPAVVPPNYAEINGDGSANGTKNGDLPSGGAGTMFVTSRQLTTVTGAAYTGAAESHDNQPPTLALWALVKS